MRLRHRKEIVRSRQDEANKALATSQEVSRVLDELEKDVVDKVRLLRRLNQENNFAPRLAAIYGGELS